MPAKKFYAVKTGRKTGIFTSWEACKKNVDGFPNAIYKSFPTREHANAFLLGNASCDPETIRSDKDTVTAYIDGSYSSDLKRFSYAAVLFVDDEKITYSDSENDPAIVELRNVAGELKAAMYAMQFAKEKDKKRLVIYYDYSGIEMWATGMWKANLPYTQAYAKFARKMGENLEISFVKVKSHSGNTYNDEADNLAKMALLKEIDVQDESTVNTETIDNLTEKRKGVLSCLKGNKTTLNLNLLSREGLVIGSDNILKIAKSKWKDNKKSIKDIQEIKAYYDIDADLFVVGIFSNESEYIYTFRSDEWDG